jgi:hypothetical protein
LWEGNVHREFPSSRYISRCHRWHLMRNLADPHLNVAHDYEIDEKRKVLRLLDPSIINGSQTQGVLRDYYRDMEEGGITPLLIHVTFELIVTDDEKLMADTSISRNFQEDVMTISIAGRLGQLEDLEMAVQRVYPEYRLRQSETQLSDDYIVTERLIQVMTALTPPELWTGKIGEDGNPIKTYTYSAKTKCLRDFQEVFRKAKDPSDPEHEKYKALYWFWRWEVEARNKLAGLLVPLIHPLLPRSMQQDLDALAKGFGPQEDQQRRSAAYLARPGVIVLVAASVLLVYLLRRRSKASSP